ncbi:Zn-dependent hydrolase [Microbaculum marinisediminis]|uniref:Zn-dependent hydrolase n=1 Tax=Microbaculum marinisediminis TaxID=2931392 RepID=A0AAW5QUY0_9HYPH|nr:Zn-dependent hydrolase [Microbaculum sp. A6E488]MCT8971304.1 Zn-dependent hydrolase [Microbaculum sp. A6E488]
MTSPADNLRINGERLWDSLMEMAKIGPGARGGNNRLTLTDDDKKARELFISWCEGAGCTTAVDSMGNIFARREGTDPSLPPVMVGSHLDTQPTGGKFDGVLGVLAGLEILRSLNDMGIRTKHPIEVVDWTNEEGSRFAPAMISSGVFAGVYSQEEAYALTDRDGKALGDELKRIGFVGDETVGTRPLKAFFELHIEQGPILEAEEYDVGVVTHGQGQRWFDVKLTGFESHAGTTPMPRRKDALVGAAKLVQAVNEIALANAPHAVGTVGVLEPYPGSRNVIPGAVSMTVDFRHPDDTVLLGMADALKAKIAEVCAEHKLTEKTQEVFYYAPVAFDDTCVAAVRNAAERLGYKHRDIVSGAGHDACYIARVAPTSMVFTPCVDGISHNEDEDISLEWATAGADVLFHAVVETAEIVE